MKSVEQIYVVHFFFDRQGTYPLPFFNPKKDLP